MISWWCLLNILSLSLQRLDGFLPCWCGYIPVGGVCSSSASSPHPCSWLWLMMCMCGGCLLQDRASPARWTRWVVFPINLIKPKCKSDFKQAAGFLNDILKHMYMALSNLCVLLASWECLEAKCLVIELRRKLIPSHHIHPKMIVVYDWTNYMYISMFPLAIFACRLVVLHSISLSTNNTYMLPSTVSQNWQWDRCQTTTATPRRCTTRWSSRQRHLVVGVVAVELAMDHKASRREMTSVLLADLYSYTLKEPDYEAGGWREVGECSNSFLWRV